MEPTFFSAIPVAETQIGIAKEAERGKPVAPGFWLPIKAPKYKPELKLLPDEGLRGSMVTLYDEVPSLRTDMHGWDQYPYLDTLPLLLMGVLGSKDTKTTAPAGGKLKTEAAKGAEHIITEATIAEGSYIVLGSGVGVQETVLTKKVVEKGPGEFEVEIAYPLHYAHPAAQAYTGLTKHQFSLLNNAIGEGNQPPSFTLTDFAGEEAWRQLAAAQLSSLNIKGTADSLPTCAVEWFANPAIKPSPPSASYSTAEAPPGWALQVSIGGTQVTYVVSWEFDFKRNVKPIPALTGTQAYYQLFAGPLDATAKMVLLDDPKALWLTAYLKGELESMDLTISDVKSGNALNLHSTEFKFTVGELDRSKEWVEVPLELQLIPSAADALAGGVSPVKATVANGQTTEY